MGEAVRRIASALTPPSSGTADDLYAATIAKSFVLSVDMAHAVHPNFQSKHEQVCSA